MLRKMDNHYCYAVNPTLPMQVQGYACINVCMFEFCTYAGACMCACMCAYSSKLAVLMLVRWLVLPANGIEMVIRAN